MKQPFISLRRDARGVSEVLGGVLMFGLVATMLVIVQVNAVPVDTRTTEFDHNQRVQADLLEFEGAVMDVAQTGEPSTVTIESGVRYPSRLLLLNPPPSSGSVRTVDLGTVEIENARAIGSADAYWDGRTVGFDTTGLTYAPDYNEYDAAPVTGFEHAITYNTFGEDTALAISNDGIVNGRDITVYVLSGDVDRTAVDDASIELSSVSGPTQPIAVTNDTGPITLRFPTTVPESTWIDLLEDQLAANGGSVTDVQYVDGDPATVEITLEADVTYDLRVAHVGIGSTTTADTAVDQYLTTADGDGVTVFTGSTQQIVFQARNAYNGPVSGVPVDATIETGDGTLQPVEPVTDENGRATFRYTAATAGDVTIQGTIGAGTNDSDTATATVTVIDPTSGDTELGALVNPNEPGSVVLRNSTTDDDTVTMRFENTGSGDRSIEEARINFYYVGPPGSSSSANSRDRPALATVTAPSSAAGETLEIAGPYEVFEDGIVLEGEAVTEVTLAFETADGSPFTVATNDYYIFTVVYEDGGSALYFVSG